MRARRWSASHCAMELKWIVLAALVLIMVCQVDAEIESRPDIWSPRSKDHRKKLGKLSAWDKVFKNYYLDDKTIEEESEFYFNHIWPKEDKLEENSLKCVPGRTTIKLIEKPAESVEVNSSQDEDEDIGNALRSHMNTKIKEDYCKVCVCSVEGKDEYCSGRPAMNVNECLRMSTLMEQFHSNIPFDHKRTLAYRIRRDYLWHNDEIPYEAKAKCKRGVSYYSNSVTANDTDIDVASDVESLLDYSNKDVCFYCVCAVHGRGVGCIKRDTWFCEYYRTIREEDAPRDMAKKLFNQDRPTYFRQLSWRLRRTMDDGLYDLRTAVGSDTNDDESTSCVPFISEYTDCTSENRCKGCVKCLCLADATWSCTDVQECTENESEYQLEDSSLDDVLNQIQYSMSNNYNPYNMYNPGATKGTSKTSFVPRPPEKDSDLLLGFGAKSLESSIASLLRNKRSIENANNTDAVKFYHTVDEINEDTLKHGNVSGTLQAHKVDGVISPKISRRTGVLNADNVSQSSLHIQYNEPKVYDPHLADNKIDAVQHEDQFESLSHNKILTIIGNHTQKQKDKDLSKLVVNELKSGQEIIGDEHAKIMSNITFTPENDTLIAMAFIAGNLLNKLWNMERDSGEDSVETEVLKHEKISDLLNLFKEPLNLRQENFLKSALEQLSEAIDKDKTLKNVTLCEKIEKSKGMLRAINGSNEEGTTERNHASDNVDNKESSLENNSEVATEAITKINNILNLINKFQKVQKNLNTLKQKSESKNANVKRKANKAKIPKELSLSKDEASSLNVFGTILEKITKLLMPPKKSKKMAKNIRNQNVFKNNNEIAATLKHLYNIDVDSSDLSSKDKLIFDYLSTVKRNPNCILEHLKEGKQSPITKTEGDILLNLSEFFKIKSYVDLLKLLELDNKANVRSSNLTTTSKPELTSEKTTTRITATTEISTKLANTKQKLKMHLKNIIDDLIEIQNAKGHPTNNISIVDALPCIYNMLNADPHVRDKPSKIKATTVSPVDKVTAIFHALKQDLMLTQNRRSNVITGERPKSAVVWERIIKNFDNKHKQNARRHLDIQEPKTFEELKNLIDKIESTSNTYKNDALMNGVPPSERLVLLKALSEDVKQYISALDDIDNSLFNLENISVDKKTELKDFIDNAAINLNLNERIAKNISELKVKSHLQKESSAKIIQNPKDKYIQKHSMKLLDVKPSYESKNVKFSRDSIINQLIKNRMELFIKIKESKNVDLESDINYSIAKKILAYLESGNYTIARELYKIIVSQKQKTNEQLTGDKKSVLTSGRRSSILTKEPVVQFEEPRGQSQMQWLNQDIWLKQLANLKNMRS